MKLLSTCVDVVYKHSRENGLLYTQDSSIEIRHTCWKNRPTLGLFGLSALGSFVGCVVTLQSFYLHFP